MIRPEDYSPAGGAFGAPSGSPEGNPSGDTTNRSTTMETMERKFARFGARLVVEHWLARGSSGFISPEGSEMDTCARGCGLMVPESLPGKSEVYDPLPGVEYAAGLLASSPLTDAERQANMQRRVAELAWSLGLRVELPGGEVGDG